MIMETTKTTRGEVRPPLRGLCDLRGEKSGPDYTRRILNVTYVTKNIMPYKTKKTGISKIISHAEPNCNSNNSD